MNALRTFARALLACSTLTAAWASTGTITIIKTSSASMSWWVVANDSSQGPPAGSMIGAANYSCTTYVGQVDYSTYTTSGAGSVTVWALNGCISSGATHAQRVAAGGYAAQTVSWTAGQTGSLGTVTISGSAPPTYSKHSWNQTVTNTSAFRQRYRWRIDYETGTDSEEVFTLEPGQSKELNVENASPFTPSLEVENVLSDGQGTVWVPTAGLNNVDSTTESSPTSPVSNGTTSNGNIWNSTDAPTRLGTQPPITANTETRSDTTASTGDTLNRQREANDEKRHAELKSLLVAADSAEAKRDTVQLDAFNQGMARLQAQTAASGAAVAAAINGLKGSLEAGQSGTQPTFNGTGAATDLQGRTTGAGGALEDLLPEVTIPAAEAPKLTLPFSLLHEDLEDVEWDFGSDELAPVVEKVRAVELVGLTCFFFLAALRLIGGK